jgi:archaetidylinositol phosphate synthase
MVSSHLKKKFQSIVAPKIEILAKMGITPNMLTLSGLVASSLVALMYLNWNRNPWMPLTAGIFLLISGFLDAIDGILARTTGKASVFGGFIDSVADRYSDAIVLSALTLSGKVFQWYGLATLIGSLMVSYARSRAEGYGVDMAGVGLAERAERMIILALASMASLINPNILNWSLLILMILVHFTVIQRIVHFYQEWKKLRAVSNGD